MQIDIISALGEEEAVDVRQKSVGATISLISEQSKKDFDTALNLFRIGVAMNNPDTSMTAKDYHKVTGYKYEKLKIGKNLAEILDNDEKKFTECWQMYGAKTIYELYNRVKKREVHDRTYLFDSLRRKVRDVLYNIDAYENKESLYKELNSFRSMIDRFVPRFEVQLDSNYMKYSECACCGKYPPPPDGYNLRSYKGIPNILYPICNYCVSANAEPDMERLMLTYAKYAINLEDAYIKLHELLGA